MDLSPSWSSTQQGKEVTLLKPSEENPWVLVKSKVRVLGNKWSMLPDSCLTKPKMRVWFRLALMKRKVRAAGAGEQPDAEFSCESGLSHLRGPCPRVLSVPALNGRAR